MKQGRVRAEQCSASIFVGVLCEKRSGGDTKIANEQMQGSPIALTQQIDRVYKAALRR